MDQDARLRLELRPHGAVAASCPDCVFYEDCGGFEPEPSLLDDCFLRNCCRQPGCDNVCPFSGRFPEQVAEVGGLGFDDLPAVSQRPADLPVFVPMIHHRYSRRVPLDWPVVALDTYRVFRLSGGRYRAVAADPDGLRRALGLSPATRVILRGTGPDPDLERYWSYRRRDQAPGQMARLGASLVIGPNFSHFLEVPRTDNLFNRKRQLICLGEMAEAGMSPVPHLSAVQPGDWRFWGAYLRANPAVRFVAVEFQTGNKAAAEGRRVIDRVAAVRDAIGRPLHLLAVGAAQYTEYLAARLGAFTLIDSAPFMKAVNRLAFDPSAGDYPWRPRPTPPGQPIDDLARQNVAGYAAWIEARVAAVAGSGRRELQTC